MSDLKPPERIWLQYHEPEGDQITWERDQIHDSDVEYQRTPPPEEAEPTEWLPKRQEHERLLDFLLRLMTEGWEHHTATDKAMEAARIEQVLFFLYHIAESKEPDLEDMIAEWSGMPFLKWIKRVAKTAPQPPEGEAERDRRAMEYCQKEIADYDRRLTAAVGTKSSVGWGEAYGRMDELKKVLAILSAKGEEG